MHVQCLSLLLLVAVLLPASLGCFYKNEKREHGEVWVVRSTFLMNCTIRPDGSWFTSITGCRSHGGVEMKPGDIVWDGDQTIECVIKAGGHVEIRRTLPKPDDDCQERRVGESWVSKRNFNKTCLANGTVAIVNCLSDSGIPFPLNTQITFSGIRYSCTTKPNGHVVLERENVPPNELLAKARLPSSFSALPPSLSFSASNYSPSGPFSPSDSPSFSHSLPSPSGPLPPPGSPSFSHSLPSPSHAHPPSATPPPGFFSGQNELLRGELGAPDDVVAKANRHNPFLLTAPVSDSVTCNGDGITRVPAETWISENKFTKRCSPTGAVIIINCIINDEIVIRVNSATRIGNKVYSCKRRNGSVFYEEIILQ